MLVYIFLLANFIYLIVRWTAGNRKYLPPGPFQWPLIGNIIQIRKANPKYVYLAMHELSKKYGEIMSIKFGVHQTVVLSSYEIMKDLLNRNELAGRYDLFPFIPDRSFHQVLGPIFMSGDLWRNSRRFTLKNLRDIGFGKRSSMEELSHEELDNLLANLKTSLVQSNNIIDINPDLFSASVVNILLTYLVGWRFPPGDEKLQLMIEHNVAVVKAMDFNGLDIIFPKLRHWFPFLVGYEEKMSAYKQLQDFMRDLINQIRTDFKKAEDPSFVQAYLAEMENHLGESNDKTIFTEEHLIMNLKDLFLGGSETTSNTLTWAILYMILHPQVQQRIQQEIDENLNPNEPISASMMSKLPYTEATILELFRIAVVAPLPLPRKTMKDCKYKEYFIPKNTCVFFNLYSIHMDEKYWGDPTVFRPERFLNADQTKVVNQERVVAFGFGKRICLGESLARNSFFIYFVTLFRTFSFENPSGEELPGVEPQPALTLKPHNFKARVTARMT